MNRPHFLAGLAAAFLLSLLPDTAQAQAQNAARIREGDAVTITIRGVPDRESKEINGVYKVDQNGLLVGLPYLESHGQITAAGLTEGQLGGNIAAAYKSADIFTKAAVTAIVDQPNARATRRVTVGGRVARPGPVDWNEGMAAFDAFTSAGGADRFGQKKRVFLTREGTERRTLNMDKPEDQAFKLLPGDTLEVDGKKPWEP